MRETLTPGGKPVAAAIDTLLEDHTDAEIADILNQRGPTSGKGLPLHRLLVRDIRQDYQLTSRFDRLRDRCPLTAFELADLLGVSVPTVWKWHRAGLLEGEKCNDKNACLYPPSGAQPAPRPARRTPRPPPTSNNDLKVNPIGEEEQCDDKCLSQQCPVRPTDRKTPNSVARAANCWLVYCSVITVHG